VNNDQAMAKLLDAAKRAQQVFDSRFDGGEGTVRALLATAIRQAEAATAAETPPFAAPPTEWRSPAVLRNDPPAPPQPPPARERLAELEHEQWIMWSQNIAKTEQITPARRERWTALWRPREATVECPHDVPFPDLCPICDAAKLERLRRLDAEPRAPVTILGVLAIVAAVLVGAAFWGCVCWWLQ
jgi:hypothetical protein